MPQGVVLLLLAVLALIPGPGRGSGDDHSDQGCSVLYATDGSLALAGNNEDFVIPLTKVWFVPAMADSFGGVYFGFDNYFAQGGMNDRGLFFDALALSETVPVAVEGKEPAFAAPADLIMARCGTVACALEVLDRYSFGGSWSYQLFFGDATGESVIVEPDAVIRQRGGFQVATNFRQSVTPEDAIDCPRYLTAVDMLGGMDVISIESMRDMLDAVHTTDGSQTLYSNVYDLTHRRVHVWFFHDYEHPVVFDLDEELAQGAHAYDLPALFPPNPEAEAWAAEPMSRYWRLVDDRRATGDEAPDLGAYEGEYALPADWGSVGTTAVVLEGEESLLLQFPDASRYELHPETETRFFHVGFRGTDPAVIFQVRFEFNESGRVGSMVMELGAEEVVFPRIASGEAPGDSVAPSTSTSVPATTTIATSATTSTSTSIATATSTAPPAPSESDGGWGALWPWLAASAGSVAVGLGWFGLRRRSLRG